MIQRLPSSAILAAALVFGGLAAASPARALGFGAAPASIPLGQPLDLSVPLRLGDAAAPPVACLQAQVSVGERRLPPGSVHLQLEGREPPRVRIRSEVAVHEPTVTVRLTAGCQGAVSRQFVIFADPALQGTAGAAAPVSSPQRATAVDASHAPTPAKRIARREPPARAVAVASVAAQVDAAPRPAPARTAPEADLAAMAAPMRLPSAEQAEATAAWAAVATAEKQLTQMKGELAQARNDVAAQRDSLTQLRTRLTQAEHHGRVQAALAAFVLALGLVALWLGWRVRALQRERQSPWWPGAAPALHDDEGMDDSEALRPAAPKASGRAALPTPAARTPAKAGLVAALPLSGSVDEVAAKAGPRVDALIDLEQQVEFFVLLGDDDAAVDLLRAHLRAHDDAGPLPYLKLLQIHRRRDEREAHARVGRRFAQHFAVPAPGWDAGADASELHDDASIVAELQARWPEPAQAMSRLEQLLCGAHGGARLSLSACCDALTLYAVARDLLGWPRQAAADVDLLLPLAAGEEVAALLRPSIFDTLQPRASEPAEIDVDLSEPGALLDGRAGALSPSAAPQRRGA